VKGGKGVLVRGSGGPEGEKKEGGKTTNEKGGH